ncbi:hypothetical protein ACA910_020577 [Epithemia clementina (nom. ined.)]
MCDGSLNPLAFTPETEDHADYNGRKFGYSISTLIVNDDKRNIIYYLAGWPGSAHDNRIFKNSALFTNPAQYFSPLEYILGDSAYESLPFLISAYKKPHGAQLPQVERNFNEALSRPRVESEHTIGMWKGRFPWLRSIRIRLTERESSLKKILDYIMVSVILHNFLNQRNDDVPEDWIDDDDASDVDDCLSDNDELNMPLDPNLPNKHRREQLKNFFDEFYVPM